MTTSEIIGTYARVLYDLASTAEAVDAADEGLRTVVSTVQGNVDLRDALADSAIPAEKKREIVRDLFGDVASPEAVAIASLAIERGAVQSLGLVLEKYGEIAEAERGVVVAEVTTAVPLTDALRAMITEKLTASLGQPVALRERVDASILGGVRVNVAGRVLDGTLASQLDAMRIKLGSALQGGEA